MFEIKDGGSIVDVDVKSRKVSGYLSSFDTVDSDGDIFQKTAYDKTIAERKDQIFFLQQHDWSRPLGKFDELKADDTGLYFVGNVINTTYGEDQLKLYEAGVVAQHSVGFVTIKSEKKGNNPRLIQEVKLYEGSAVTLGANSNTPYLGIKTSQKDIKSQISKIMNVLKSGNLTDETFMQLELALNLLQKKSYNLGKHSNETNEPQVSTQLDFEPLINTINNFKI